jgi:hypothetical protein
MALRHFGQSAGDERTVRGRAATDMAAHGAGWLQWYGSASTESSSPTRMSFVTLNEVSPCAVDWLWPGRLARGHLHILDGDPNLGKSLVLLDLAARLTTGRPFPDGAATAPTSVLVFNAEDGARDTVLPRLLAAGADVARVTVWERDADEEGFFLPSQAGQLEAVLQRTGAGLVVLDPLLAFLDAGVNIANDPSVRRALAPLAALAKAYRCAFVMLRHLNKEGGGQALYRGLASIAFVAACRIAWLIGADPRVPRRFVLSQSKNNLDPPQPSLAYTISADGPRAAPRVEWLGVSPWSGADLLDVPTARGRERRRAAEFLAAFLRDGARPAHAIFAAARPLDLNERTLRRAAVDLDIRKQRVGGGRKDQTTYWLLPGQQLCE